MQANAGGIVDADGLGTGLGGRRRLAGRGGARTAAPSEAGTDLRGATGRWSVLDETRQPPQVLRVEAKPQAGRVRNVDRQLR